MFRSFGSILTVMIVFATTVCSAATLQFRSGTILAAQLSTKEPRIANLDKFDFDYKFNRRCYALVVVNITPGRSLSTHDYSLDVFRRKYPCVAIQRENGPFDADQWELSNLKRTDRLGMLFILDGSTAGIDNVEKFKLVSNAPGNYPAVTVPFLNRRAQALASAGSIPPAGTIPEQN